MLHSSGFQNDHLIVITGPLDFSGLTVGVGKGGGAGVWAERPLKDQNTSSNLTTLVSSSYS